MKEGHILKRRYRIIQDLKRGAFGKTYLAEDEQSTDKCLCVVKELQPSTTDLTILEEARRRFELEAITLQKLGDHPQIPQLLDHFEENQEFYLVQEFVDGQDLSRELAEGTRLSEAKVVSLLYDTLEVLEYIHHQNVIHRDIKPSNLIRRQSDYKIVIIDFGAVKEIETLVLSKEGLPSGSVVGTPGYMPWEHLSGRPRMNSDIYALGITAIQALTGISPLKLPRHPQTDQIVWRNLVQVNPELGDILDRMVLLRYQERYQTASEVLADLQGLHQELRNIYRIGHILDHRYQVVGLLGEGAYGNTYLAVDQQRNLTRCVIKQIKLKVDDPYIVQEAKNVFEGEAQILHNLGNHDKIPTLWGDFQDAQGFYLVYEYIDGDALTSEIYPGSCWTEEQVIVFLEDVLQTLAFVHQSTIHFDIKPSNLIRRTQDGKIVIIDFSAVKQISNLVLNYQGQLSITGVVGTPGYMPKEQKAGNPRPNNDIYALGITVIQALTGKTPEELPTDPNTGEIAWRKYAKVGNRLAAILDKMVHSYFRSRYESAEEVLTDLQQIQRFPESESLPRTHPFAELEYYANNGVPSSTETENGLISTVETETSFPSKDPKTQENSLETQVELEELPQQNRTTPFSHSLPGRLIVASPSSPQSSLNSQQWKWSLIVLFILTTTAGVFIWPYAQFQYSVHQCSKLIDLEKPEEALEKCEQALTLKPNSALVLKNLADALYDLERYEAAGVSYEKAIQTSPNYIEALNGRGQVLYQLKRYAEALKVYDQALQINPQNYKILNGRGIALIGLERYEEALESFEKAILMNPSDAKAWENKGLVLGYLQRPRESRDAYEEAIAIYTQKTRKDPQDFVAYVDRGRVLNKLQRHPEALESYNQALEINPTFYRAWIGKGTTLFFLQRFEEALQAYNKAAEIRPKYYLVWHNRGSLLADGLQRYQDAIASYQKAVDRNPEFAPAWRDQGQAFMRLEQYKEAIAVFDKAIKLNPNDSQTWSNRGIALAKLQRYEEAIVALEKAVSLNKNDPIAWANLGWALAEWGRYSEAIAAYDNAIQLKPDFTPAIESRQQLLEK